jgi:hypothetical protein
MDVIIKNVPVEAIASVKQMAMVAIERHLKSNLSPSAIDTKNFEDDVNSVYVTNGFSKKYKGEK